MPLWHQNLVVNLSICNMKRIAIIANPKTIDISMVQFYLKEAYDVKVSTEDISDKSNYEHLMSLHNADHLHIQELDNQKPNAINEFLKDCDYVIISNTYIHQFIVT